jgi:hypothetical protein
LVAVDQVNAYLLNQGGDGCFDGLFVQRWVFQGNPGSQNVAAVGVARHVAGPPGLGCGQGVDFWSPLHGCHNCSPCGLTVCHDIKTI